MLHDGLRTGSGTSKSITASSDITPVTTTCDGNRGAGQCGLQTTSGTSETAMVRSEIPTLNDGYICHMARQPQTEGSQFFEGNQMEYTVQ